MELRIPTLEELRDLYNEDMTEAFPESAQHSSGWAIPVGPFWTIYV